MYHVQYILVPHMQNWIWLHNNVQSVLLLCSQDKPTIEHCNQNQSPVLKYRVFLPPVIITGLICWLSPTCNCNGMENILGGAWAGRFHRLIIVMEGKNCRRAVAQSSGSTRGTEVGTWQLTPLESGQWGQLSHGPHTFHPCRFDYQVTPAN